jgi:type II restriction endonuclease hpaII
MEIMTVRANKGEWTELYVLFKLITDGKLFQSDMNLEPDGENIYQVMKSYKSEREYQLEFEREEQGENQDQVKIHIFKVFNNQRNLLNSYTYQELTKVVEDTLSGVKEGKGRSFSIPELNSFLQNNQIETAKADSGTKSDIRLKIYDHRLAKDTDLGFSIKSLLGKDATLLNTGAGNNFIYKVKNLPENFDLQSFNSNTYKTGAKITARLEKIRDIAADCCFQKIQSKQFYKNLKIIDGDLPEILAHCLYLRYLNKEPSIEKLVEILEDSDPLNFYEGEKGQQKFYEYKIKKFLVESAMGMTSEAVWLGEYDSFGGVIVAKKDGSIVCFHIYDFNLLRNYLLKRTKLEQAATGEDENNPGYPDNNAKKKYFYGWLFKEDHDFFIKLNLQVRFK